MSRIWRPLFVLTLLASITVPGLQGQTRPAPILLVVNATAPNPFGRYLGEILRAEGINTFATADLASLTSAALDSARLVVLADTPLSASQASLLRGYIAAGGRLVAMRPDAQLADTLGVADLEPSSAERYLAINPATAIGRGLPATTLPLKGPVQHCRLSNGATALATLYTDRTTSTDYPAVVQFGKTVTWTFDLARSIVYTRQGDPVNAGTVRDGVAPVRSTSVFFGAIDLDRVSLPHADIQMRLFSRVITDLLADVVPLPRLWYFPDANRTVLVPTADNHGVANNAQTQQEVASVEARGGRLSMYVTRSVSYPDAATTSTWRANGHEIGLHPYASADDTPLEAGFRTATDWFKTRGLGKPGRTARMHQVEWPSWVGPAQTEAKFNIGLDTTFYTWGPAVTYPDGHQAHGFITGSGLPMRFVDQAGTIIPVYQQVTSIIDEQLIPICSQWAEKLSPSEALSVSKQLIDDSQSGGYSALVTQFHTDYYAWGEVQPWADGTMDYARSLGIPIWTAERWLNYTEARAATQIANLVWSAPMVSLTVTVPAGAEPQSLMLPAFGAGRAVTTVSVDGKSVTPVTQMIAGRESVFVSVAPGTHDVAATYSSDAPRVNHPPTAVDDTVTSAQGGAVTIPVLSNDSDPDGDPLTVTAVTQGSRGEVAINADNTITYKAGPTCGTDTFTCTISDGRGGSTTGTVVVTIACTGGQIEHTTSADFGCGQFTDTMQTSIGDGAVRLAGTFGDEYNTATVDSGRWTAGTWSGGGYAPIPIGGALSIAGVGGAFVRSATPLPVTTLEATVRFSAATWEHIGWGALNLSGPYLLFSTANTASTLSARTSADGASEQRTELGPIPSGFHTYRIERVPKTPTTDLVSYLIDGEVRATHTVATMRALHVYQSHNGGASPTLDIDRIWVYPPYVPSGTYQSCTVDAGRTAAWKAVVWRATVPARTSLEISTRTSNDGSIWSAWSEPLTTSGATPTSPPGRYLQYRIRLNSGTPQDSPVVESITVTYDFVPAD